MQDNGAFGLFSVAVRSFFSCCRDSSCRNICPAIRPSTSAAPFSSSAAPTTAAPATAPPSPPPSSLCSSLLSCTECNIKKDCGWCSSSSSACMPQGQNLTCSQWAPDASQCQSASNQSSVIKQKFAFRLSNMKVEDFTPGLQEEFLRGVASLFRSGVEYKQLSIVAVRAGSVIVDTEIVPSSASITIIKNSLTITLRCRRMPRSPPPSQPSSSTPMLYARCPPLATSCPPSRCRPTPSALPHPLPPPAPQVLAAVGESARLNAVVFDSTHPQCRCRLSASCLPGTSLGATGAATVNCNNFTCILTHVMQLQLCALAAVGCGVTTVALSRCHRRLIVALFLAFSRVGFSWPAAACCSGTWCSSPWRRRRCMPILSLSVFL